MIISFANKGTEDVYDGRNTKAARRTCPAAIWSVAQRKMTQLNAAERLQNLAIPPSNRLEALKGDRKGQHSIRINDQYRLCFSWTNHGPAEVELTDYH
ncbi:MAG: type II toxin-antitoxin system RelE/ParE family toxin [Gemmatimonadota bacterium]